MPKHLAADLLQGSSGAHSSSIAGTPGTNSITVLHALPTAESFAKVSGFRAGCLLLSETQEPDTDYRYRISGADRAQTFHSAPLPGHHSRFTFLAFGDMGDATHVSAKSPG